MAIIYSLLPYVRIFNQCLTSPHDQKPFSLNSYNVLEIYHGTCNQICTQASSEGSPFGAPKLQLAVVNLMLE